MTSNNDNSSQEENLSKKQEELFQRLHEFKEKVPLSAFQGEGKEGLTSQQKAELLQKVILEQQQQSDPSFPPPGGGSTSQENTQKEYQGNGYNGSGTTGAGATGRTTGTGSAGAGNDGQLDFFAYFWKNLFQNAGMPGTPPTGGNFQQPGGDQGQADFFSYFWKNLFPNAPAMPMGNDFSEAMKPFFQEMFQVFLRGMSQNSFPPQPNGGQNPFLSFFGQGGNPPFNPQFNQFWQEGMQVFQKYLGPLQPQFGQAEQGFQNFFKNFFPNNSPFTPQGEQGNPSQGGGQPPPFGFNMEGIPNLFRYFTQNMFQNATSQEGPPPGGEEPSSPLIKMKSGNKTPFYCVHALLGSTFHYYNLANRLDADQPFYALQAPGLGGDEPPLDKTEEFAALYLEKIREVQPHGPYKLGGYSFGGWVAFEMARQLNAQGEKVNLVVVFGSCVPLSVSHPHLFQQVDFFQKYAKDFKKIMVDPFLSDENRMSNEKTNSGDEYLTPLQKVVNAHNHAVMTYDPKPYSEKVTLFETLELQTIYPYDTSRGWGRLSAKEVENHFIGGNHLSMLEEPYLQQIAEKLTLILNSSEN